MSYAIGEASQRHRCCLFHRLGQGVTYFTATTKVVWYVSWAESTTVLVKGTAKVPQPWPIGLRQNGRFLMKATESKTNPDREPEESAHSIANGRPGSGFLVFTTSLQLLHRNPQALELSRRISQAETGTAASGMFPKAVTDLCHEVRRGLQIRIDAEDWAQFQVQRLIGDMDKPVVLQGIGVPDRGGLTRSRILIVMKEVGR